MEELPNKPYAKVASIPERGMKCRVVTKSPVGLVTLGDKLRKILFRSLERDNRVRDSLEGDHMLAVTKAFNRSKFYTRLDSRLL